MTEERNKSAVAILQVFNREQLYLISEFFATYGSSGPNRVESERKRKYGLPAIMSWASPSYGIEFDESKDVLAMMAMLSTMIFTQMHEPKDEETWREFFIDAFKIDEDLAEKLAEDIDTAEDVQGFLNNASYALKSAYNNTLGAITGTDFNQDTLETDLDYIYEHLQAGHKILELLKRTFITRKSMENSPKLKGLSLALTEQAAGDPLSAESAQSLVTYTPLINGPRLSDEEIGGLFSGVGNFFKKVGSSVKKSYRGQSEVQ